MNKFDIDKGHVPDRKKHVVTSTEYNIVMRERHKSRSFIWAAKDVDHLAVVGYDLNGMAIGYSDTLTGAEVGMVFYLYDYD